MVSRYSVIQYVPDPIADERINIGVVAFDENAVRIRFVSRWERVRYFGMEEIDFLKNFAHQIENEAKQGLLLPADQFQGMSNTEKIIKVSKSWINSIQFTEPRGSLDNIDELIEYIASAYLREIHAEAEPKNKARDRKVAARIVKSTTRKILKQELGEEAKELLKSDYKIPGRHKTNRFDVVIANGRPYFAAHGISFEVDVPDRLTDAILWRISDVKYNQSDFPLGILILPPKAEQHNYNELKKVYLKTIDTYKELGADIVRENEVESWVENQIVNIHF